MSRLSDILCILWLHYYSVAAREEALVVVPRLYNSSSASGPIYVELGGWVLVLGQSGNLRFAPGFAAVWIRSSGAPRGPNPAKCDHLIGSVSGLESESRAAVSICPRTSLIGYFRLRDAFYFFRPLRGGAASGGDHVLFKSGVPGRPGQRRRRRVAKLHNADWLYNLTGDTFDGLDFGDENRNHGSRDSASPPPPPLDLPRGSWTDEDNGYFYDSAWSALGVQRHRWGASGSPQKWLEIAICVDHSVVAFHGKKKVEQYVLALMNIVNAIYQDTSLEANMQLVISRLLLYDNKKLGVVRPGNAKKSLENVNSWNKKLQASLKPGETPHDVAIWLTRLDIGGPSGYAPVGGACDPERSCALNKDEGLSSAFIIAHEMAHVLGLSHDGDAKANNDCDDDTMEGSVMAPMVSATFNKFAWSECSRREFRTRSRNWTCLLNPPGDEREIVLNETLQSMFTMDEQCRMEFGNGYSMCRAFDIIEPCSHLWCGHASSPLVCKTKKGPPLEGTECGFGKWCANGYCSDILQAQGGRVPVVLNPQHGGWGDWGPWGGCSRTCGAGVRFRTRECDNPRPSYGGRGCDGDAETWEICNVADCPGPYVDLRARQCKMLPRIFNASSSDTWLPYERDDVDDADDAVRRACKFACVSEERKEVFATDENFADGTPCSYENQDDICVQGWCQTVGCDGKLNSTVTRDSCGVCGGDDSQCVAADTVSRRRLKRSLSRIGVIPKMARQIRVEANVTVGHFKNSSAAFILKRRKKKAYAVTIPNAVVRSKIVEGTNFFYKKSSDTVHEIWAKGPVLSEMVVIMVTTPSDVDRGVNVSSRVSYSIHKDSLKPSARFVWIRGGWGPCSASCGGGKRQKTNACWDERSGKIVRKKFCSLLNKPALETETCNSFGCDFAWVAGEWEPCSATCGYRGTQWREIYCVPGAIGINRGHRVQLWRYMVEPGRCRDSNKPLQTRPCNRVPCFRYWEYGNWSQCSTTCGTGVSIMTPHCPAGLDGTCGDPPPPKTKACTGVKTSTDLCKGRKTGHCRRDESKYCVLELLSKYCQLKAFKRVCCKSCGRPMKQNNI
ncbi:A disintegrin and metalloproteinase with thrombospondin motifs 2-like isoform X2 [Cylas formicarius]|uniref:A disintegrin and metalloproteinase with thrombospondin motifs 2-like isoform X2 n=1 Tax=Cylas formicarius TaxID=197179 RepID=UPI0029583F38|nr:A disintegrin and metalloproteinase with thrombospondin motifs 2-like isoform X2 [Cylas formicarius]